MRQERIRQALGRHGGVLLLAPGETFQYVAGWTPLADERLTFLVVAPDQMSLVVPSVNAEEARSHLGPSVLIRSFTDQEGPDAIIEAVMREYQGDIWYMADQARFDHVRWFLTGKRPLELASKILDPLRMVKSADEILSLERAQIINDRAMEAAFQAVQPEMTELELADVIRRAFVQFGADREAFIIVAAGSHSAHPHHLPDSTVLGPGPVLLDIGCFKNGYASDMTRMVQLGPPSEKYLLVHSIVEQAVQAGLEAARPGVCAEAVDQACREVIDKAGWGPYFVHRTGHGIGLAVHERPYIMGGSLDRLEPGMTFSIEPGIYLPGEFGVRLEEVVVMGETGPRVLSKIPRDAYRRNEA